MSGMLINLIVQIIAGAIGGNVAGGASKDLSLGTAGNTIAGAIGGGVGGQILTALVPMLAQSAGNIDIGALVGQFVGGGADRCDPHGDCRNDQKQGGRLARGQPASPSALQGLRDKSNWTHALR